MIYKSRLPKAKKQTQEESIPQDEFFLTRGLTTSQLDLMDGYFELGDDDKEALRVIIPIFAKRNKNTYNYDRRKSNFKFSRRENGNGRHVS